MNVEAVAGDWVRDPMDGEMRKIESIWGNTVYMEDGGVMGLDEIGRNDLFLPGENDGYN